MNILQKAVDLAVKNLAAAGAQYRIVTAEGLVITNIIEAASPVKVRRVQNVARGEYMKFYEPALSSMAPGEFKEIEIPASFIPEIFRSSACGYATRHWGRSAYTTELKDGKLMVLRY